MAFRKEDVSRALDSQDPGVIKGARKTQRQALTRWYNTLAKELDKKDDSGQLDFSRISEKWVNEILTKAKEAYRDLVDLHEHYLARSSFGIVNTDKEDDDYLTKADEDYGEIIRMEELFESKTKERKPNVAAAEGSAKVSSSGSYLKLKKYEVRSFSGQRREYAAWKRDFKEIVIDGGRLDVDYM